MSHIGDSERKTQNRVIRFFQDTLHYAYLGNLRDQENRNIIPDLLLAYLQRRGYSDTLARRAIDMLSGAAANLQHGLYDANIETYTLLKYGAKVREGLGESEKTVCFIDFDDALANDFSIAEEVTILGNSIKRPDMVVFVNGIALAVIELKKSSVSVSEGIRQNLANQKAHFIEGFFTTMQLCVAGNDSEGMRYGTLLTPEKYYLEWKQEIFLEFPEERNLTDVQIEEACTSIPEQLDRELYYLFHKVRFLDLMDNFLVYDKGIKKICRYNQYYAIKRAQVRLTTEHRGGIVWHTQGSGKSLTMVWLSKWILANNSNARVLIITDRVELDEQIEKTFKGVGENIKRTYSGNELFNKLNSFENRLISSLVHKFGKHTGEASDQDYDQYITELRASLPKDFSVKGDMVVFVDECHRTQSGKLHQAMKAILPGSLYIGFTGTPLLKRDKKQV